VAHRQAKKARILAVNPLRYWRCAGIGPSYVKLGGRVKYDEADVEAYVNANKRKPSVRATLEGKRAERGASASNTVRRHHG
jgi:hypothetical protein